MGVMGSKTWLPGKTLGTFITSTFGISQREQNEVLERTGDAVADTAPAVRELMKGVAGFKVRVTDDSRGRAQGRRIVFTSASAHWMAVRSLWSAGRPPNCHNAPGYATH